MKKKRVIVTGGIGFIGSHLVERLSKDGAQVTILDDFSRSIPENFRFVKKYAKIIRIDLRNFATSKMYFRNHDMLFNLAAVNTGVDFDAGRTEYMFEENMLLQMNPLHAAALAHIPTVIQMSSASVYSREAMETRIPTKENDNGEQPEVSKIGYAWAKRMGEQLARWYSADTSMKTVIARSVNVYGTRDNFDDRGHFLPCVIRKFLTAESNVEVFGSGKQKRSFVHVDDLVEALVLISRKGKRGEAYNIDSQDEHSIKEIVECIRSYVSPHIRVLYNTQLPEGSQRRILDATKIRSLGWIPRRNLMGCLPILIEDIQKRLHEK